MVHYLDHAASTPVRPVAVSAMSNALANCFGNPSGAHRLAREANRTVDAARATIAEVFGLEPGNIVFTSGGTEADSLAIHGSLRRSRDAGLNGIAVCSAVEHHAVLDPVIDTSGRLLNVDRYGVLDLEHLRLTLADLAEAGTSVAVVSVMAANNETGVVQPIIEAAEIVREMAPDALVHTDAVQFGAWRDTAPIAAAVDLMSVSAHKIGGPKGIGFLSVATAVDLPAIQIGGSQERGRRGGTQNVPGIVALAAAAGEMNTDRSDEAVRVRTLRDRMVEAVQVGVPDAVLSGAGVDRLPNIAHFGLPGIESEPLLFLMEKADVMASAASSCASGAQQASHVLAAMSAAADLGVLRLSVGYTSTEADVDAAAAAVVDAVARIRNRG